MSKLLRSFAICVLLAEISAGMAPCVRAADGNSSAETVGRPNLQPSPLATYLGVEFVKDSTTTVLLQRDGKSYVVD
jgi:hypothetical protein